MFGSHEEGLCVAVLCAYLNITLGDVTLSTFTYDPHASSASVELVIATPHAATPAVTAALGSVDSEAMLGALLSAGLADATHVGIEVHAVGEQSHHEKSRANFVRDMCIMGGVALALVAVCAGLNQVLARFHARGLMRKNATPPTYRLTM